MDIEIKKDLASNWFKLLQNAICDDISRLEKNRVKFKSTLWQRSKKKDEGGGEYRIITNGKVFEKDFQFIRDVGVTFQMIFNNIIEKKIKKKWTLKDKEMQYIKRGRYAEFNLLYDRGTKFGLQTGGNVEGILMSLPPIAKWK